eukprot:TRINITY_DN4696_c0_g1_i2.p1 TRINITY_DN4696_c0_g1~~TRINITY_DN4696_c0_g1_i2.p1  ORF type:complete len:219 (+),score=39.38 TRINITY_DN4696_c0_g1_i2:64-720(+)
MPDLASVRNELQLFQKSSAKIKSDLQTREQGGANRNALGVQIRDDVRKLEDIVKRLRQSLRSVDENQSEQDEATQAAINELRADVVEAGKEWTELDKRAKAGSAQGAEMQPVARAPVPSDYESQRELVHSRTNENLDQLDSSIGRIRQVVTANHRQIQLHNALLSEMNESTDRSQSRMSRQLKSLKEHIMANRNCWLTCSIFVLLIVIVALFVYIVLP